MIFNSYNFLIFLAVVSICTFVISYRSAQFGKIFLILSSLVFYAWWRLDYVPLLLGSIAFNYCVGRIIHRKWSSKQFAGWPLGIGVGANLCLLGFFKYAGFFAETANGIAGLSLPVPMIALPLAISFFTFQQISFLVDASRGNVKSWSFIDYGLFVTFFPQLIAGPIVHHKEMLPQLVRDRVAKFSAMDATVGLTIFALGLFKKVILADNFATFSDPVFDATAAGYIPTFLEAWGASLAYSFQIYFDFSGYSDMAVGLARIFQIKLPLNFFSPYKSRNMIEFWRRWHMTLSRFLRDYLYIPLGGSYKGRLRRYINLMVTMLLGGLWHGAGWTFIVWGAFHGAMLGLNHAWQMMCSKLPVAKIPGGRLALPMGVFVTFILVTIAWVFFRAANMETAFVVLKGMFGQNGLTIPLKYVAGFPQLQAELMEAGVKIIRKLPYYKAESQVAWLVLGFFICWVLPNTMQWMASYKPVINSREMTGKMSLAFLRWRPTAFWAIIVTLIAVISFIGISAHNSPFLYFQF